MAQRYRIGRRMHDRAFGRRGRPVAHGLCRRQLQHAVGAARSHRRNRPRRLCLGIRRRPVLARPDRPSSPPTASARHRARSFPAHGRGSTRSRFPAPSAPSPTGARMRPRDGSPTIRTHWQKALRTGRLSTFPESALAILEPHARAALLAALGKARRQGSLIAFDPNYRPRLWPNAETSPRSHRRSAASADIALPTFPDEQALFGDADPQATAARIRSTRRRGDRREERRSAGAGLEQ